MRFALVTGVGTSSSASEIDDVGDGVRSGK